MLTDLGLLSPEAFEKYFEPIDVFKPKLGCIDRLPCLNCRHLIMDSICLCLGFFICPNCGYKNGLNNKAMITKITKWKTEDGKEFDSEIEALKYENKRLERLVGYQKSLDSQREPVSSYGSSGGGGMINL